MTIGVLALQGLSPERVAALTAAGYAILEGKKYPNRMNAVREAGDTVRAVLTNGRGGLSGEEMALLPKLEIVCTVGAGYEAVDLDTARSRRHRGRQLPRHERIRCRRLRHDAVDGGHPAPARRPIVMCTQADGRTNGRSTPRPFPASAWAFSAWEPSAARSRTAARAASTWRSAITTGRPSRIALSVLRQPGRARDVGRFPGLRSTGRRGNAASRQRRRDLRRSDRKAMSSTSGAARSWTLRR